MGNISLLLVYKSYDCCLHGNCFLLLCPLSSWSNLEDLQLWLSVREVQHQFCEVKEYKGATYNGKWNMGKPQGMCVLYKRRVMFLYITAYTKLEDEILNILLSRGSMEWPDGHRYDGEFRNGKIEGYVHTRICLFYIHIC